MYNDGASVSLVGLSVEGAAVVGASVGMPDGTPLGAALLVGAKLVEGAALGSGGTLHPQNSFASAVNTAHSSSSNVPSAAITFSWPQLSPCIIVTAVMLAENV